MTMKRTAFILMASALCLTACHNGSKTEQEVKYAALSFDDGPNLVTTPKVLDVLEENGVPASFFVEGQYINDESAEMMKRAVSLGCEIENHSFTHSMMADSQTEETWVDEITRTSDLVEKYVGRRPHFFRPPYINHNEAMHKAIDLTFICGTGCEDWESSVSAQQRVETLLANVKDGDVILLHDFEGNDNTVEALKAFIPAMKELGFEFVTVSSLFEIKGVTPEPFNGKIYTNVAD